MQDISQGLIITDPQTGTRYSLIKKLGKGGFGEVWLAYDKTDIHHSVAIKFFNPIDDSDKILFLGEYERSAKFHHKDVLPSLFYGEWGNRLFMGMGYCEYGTASQFVGEMNPNSSDGENLIWNLIYDVASGLEYLHDNQNIVHQDIKPDNIMITSDGDFVIMDFGISINVNSRLASLNYKDFGSPAYMAPERFTNSGNVIFANDMWSFGVMLYELVTGELPFNGLGGNYLVGNCPSLSNEWSIELNKVIQSCLVYEPWSRKKAKDIKEYAGWVLRGKNGIDPWSNYNPNTSYPNTTTDNPYSRSSGIGTQRVGSNQANGQNVSNHNGRATSRNNNLNSNSYSNEGQSDSINNPPPPNNQEGRNMSNNNDNDSNIDEDMKYKKKYNFLLIICILLCIGCIGCIVYYSNKIQTEKHELNQILTTQGNTISSLNNLVAEISEVCMRHNNGENSDIFENWKSSNHKDNTEDSKEYVFFGQKGDEINFFYNVDSEQSYDKLSCYLISPNDTTKIFEISGLSKNGQKTLSLTHDADYKLCFKYKKDGSYSKGRDVAEISNIKLVKTIQNEVLKKINDFNMR